MNENEAQDELLDGESIEAKLSSCDSAKGAEQVVNYMISHPSREWLSVIHKAEQGKVNYADVLVGKSDELYSSIADITADLDGLVSND